MKLLIISQKVDVNDDNLSFFHRILEKFSEKLEKVYAVCLAQGKYQLPGNAKVFSLGKEKGFSKLRQIMRLQKFLLAHLREVDGIYAHMCPIYAIASCPLAKIFRKKLILWYAHGAVSWKLRLAEKLVDEIVTSSPAGCRIKSKKIKVLGQGIDTELFVPSTPGVSSSTPGVTKILYAARLVPVKDHRTLIEAVNILVNRKNIKNLKVRIMGTPFLGSQKEYLEQLKKKVRDFDLDEYIEFLPGVSYFAMPEYYQWADLFVNPSSTGSLDKVVLEAMASGCLVLTCNEAYADILDGKYLFLRKDPDDLAKKVVNLMNTPQDRGLREIVIENHNLDNLIDKIISEFNVRNKRI